MKTLKERLESKLVPNANGCLEFTGCHNGKGYGLLGVDGKTLRTHRVAWELANGEIPDGLCVLHRCDNRRCCAVNHLFLGTNSDNVADKVRKGRARTGNAGRANRVVDETMLIFMRELQMQDLNQAQIGECLGVSQITVSRYLSGKGTIPCS